MILCNFNKRHTYSLHFYSSNERYHLKTRYLVTSEIFKQIQTQRCTQGRLENFLEASGNEAACIGMNCLVL